MNNMGSLGNIMGMGNMGNIGKAIVDEQHGRQSVRSSQSGLGAAINWAQSETNVKGFEQNPVLWIYYARMGNYGCNDNINDAMVLGIWHGIDADMFLTDEIIGWWYVGSALDRIGD